MKQARILVLDFDSDICIRNPLEHILESAFPAGIQMWKAPCNGIGFRHADAGLSSVVLRFNPDIAILIISPGPLKQAGAIFQSLSPLFSNIPILLVAEATDPREMLEILKLGMADFISPPLKANDLLPRIWRLLERDGPQDLQPVSIKGELGLKQLIGQSPAFLAETRKIPLVTKCDASVMISGETGTGKEMFARAIHYLSPRANRAFIPINCSAIPVELMENELFGHKRGAFTGANSSQAGLIQEANGGTLFLDEIDSLSQIAQVKLLRLLQEKEFRPLGSTKIQRADVRVIAASNADLEQLIAEGRLRQDLYYRLNIISFKLPPLRARPEDIPILAKHFLWKYAVEFNKQVSAISPQALESLLLYPWPGNVRELEHIIEQAVILTEAEIIDSSEIMLPGARSSRREESFQEAKARVVAEFEKTYISGMLLANQGNITRAAQAAKKNRRVFWRMIRKHQIDVQSFRSRSAGQSSAPARTNMSY